MEVEKVGHMCHEHPLGRILLESAHQTDYYTVCYGCDRFFRAGDATYGCSITCGFRWLLHKECMEMPRQITHPIHPSHPLSLAISGSTKCAVCGGDLHNLAYRCSQGECDGLWIDLGCAGGLNDTQPLMDHPSHPQHELRFSSKTRWCPFPCDACGATEKGDSYTCNICNYWIHERCALLPESKDFPHHHHSLFLSFSLPSEYIKYDFDCGICSKTLPLRRWHYHCHLCRYVVHLNCAFDNQNESESAIDDDEKEATKFPIAVEDMYEEMIRPFVKEQILIVPHHDRGNGKYSFSNHPQHLLTFTTFSASSSSYDHHEKNDDDDDDDDFESITRSEIICDGCTLPIREKKQTDDDDDEKGYMRCDECKYFLHLSCFNLPLHITSHPIHPHKDHNLTLRNADAKLTGWKRCYICRGFTNVLYYACTYRYCEFTIDIKCASLPNTIKHASHPQHNYLKLLTDDDSSSGLCVNCHFPACFRTEQYRCNRCIFCICGECVMLPATNKHRLENHLLSLTYDACVNRPGEFYCSSCEYQMHPRLWMYHCRDCDQSFHPDCFPATSGYHRNIKYGTEHVISGIHDHPLRFQIISNKKRCDLCHGYCYDEPGFQCALCFFVCCRKCGVNQMDDMSSRIMR
ncbi:uncharacterized protein LOC121757161 [Salvia splendens]|uniref:uncharacterized protein LOC121757161 n=1 Tax=Salvia splendens TaxID=180675 RepID=UPI001C28015B|nr:uncharacterized protein LOC121757161 [Salvia splendens]